jgi:predicted DCC family thiol-disulfide oxidoreductase YuxK
MTRRFRLFYDGECPICRREVAWLKRHDRLGNLELENISAVGFDPARYGLTRDEVVRVLHGVKPDGVVVRGMDAVREAYRAVGWGWLLSPTRLPGLKSLSDLLYGLFARNRQAWGRLLEPKRSRSKCCDAAGAMSDTGCEV